MTRLCYWRPCGADVRDRDPTQNKREHRDRVDRLVAWRQRELRVRHYYEPARLLGKEVARSLSWADADADENAAWDIYLFYSAGARWHDALPPPETVLHQLSRRQNDSGFRTGDELVDALREATTRTLAAPGGG
jgi:hypothetical protein